LNISGGNVYINNFRKYGTTPYDVAVIHGGPGAAGEMAPVAIEISKVHGTLEPLQTAASIEGQIQELRLVLEKYGNIPLTMIGYSWGAWLSFIFAAQYPEFIRKLILIGSGPFEEKYAIGIMETRLSRLNEKEKLEVATLIKNLGSTDMKNKDALFTRFGEVISKADSFDPLQMHNEQVKFQAAIHQIVWKEAEQLRHTGDLLKFGRKIHCPVHAIHGDYDPHPAEGVEKPLLKILKNFRFTLLKNCGHRPWVEKGAREEFYKILKEEVCQKS